MVIRAMVSKIGPKSELGKIFSLVSGLESLVPIVTLPLLTKIYNGTIEIFPGKHCARESRILTRFTSAILAFKCRGNQSYTGKITLTGSKEHWL